MGRFRGHSRRQVQPDKEFLTNKEVCELLQIGRTTLYALVQSGRLRVHRPVRALRYALSDIASFVESVENLSVNEK